MRKRSLVLVLALLSIAAPSTVGAQSIPIPDIPAGKLASLTVSRTRRAIAVGPFVGAMPIIPTAGDADGAVSFGVALSLFDVPIVPDRKAIEQIVMDRAKALLKEAVEAAVLRGEEPTEDDLATMGREILRQVLAEFLEARTPKLWEKPRAHLHLAGARLFRSDAWQARATVAVGLLGRVSLGPTLMLDLDDDTDLFLGPEMSVQLLPGKGPRSPIVGVYLRADFALTRDERDALISAGGRIMLDLI